MSLYAYEVELRIEGRNGRPSRVVTRKEYAHNVSDAVMQAMFNQSTEPDSSSADLKLVRVGPPSDEVRAASVGLAQTIESALSRLTTTKGSKK